MADRHLTTLAAGYAHAAHLGQYDRDSRLHIEHVARVVGLLIDACPDPADELLATAWLHDVVEDGPTTFEYLARLGFPAEVIQAVRLLTRPDDEVGEPGAYLDYVQRIADAQGLAGTMARLVKAADLRDNIARSEAEGSDRLARRYRIALGMVEP